MSRDDPEIRMSTAFGRPDFRTTARRSDPSSFDFERLFAATTTGAMPAMSFPSDGTKRKATVRGDDEMKKCDGLVDMRRRHFLGGAGAMTAAAATMSVLPKEAKAEPRAGLVKYPSNRLGNVKDLKVNEPMSVAYPDDDAPGVLLKLGQKVATGAGPDGDIVGFSSACPHKGFPLNYNAGDRTMNCPGHYSRFDCERGGQQVWGQATQNLPQYVLRIDGNGDIFAEGVDEHIFGRLSNVL
jgi:arsenite oxidase small subunit